MIIRGWNPPEWLTLIVGNSTDQQIVSRVVSEVGPGLADMVFIDGDHTYEVASADWANYGGLVRPGGIVAFHDISPRPGYPSLQVDELWSEVRDIYDSAELISDPLTSQGTGIILR